MPKKFLQLTLIIVLLFPGLEVFCQRTENPNTSINKIKKLVKLIATDTTLRTTVLERSNIPDSAIGKFRTYRSSIQSVIAFYSGDVLKHLKIITKSFYPTETDYYLDNKQLIFMTEKYHNNSRMGSCGDLDIENRMYYNYKKLIKVETLEIPFNCYNEKVESQLILTDLNIILSF